MKRYISCCLVILWISPFNLIIAQQKYDNFNGPKYSLKLGLPYLNHLTLIPEEEPRKTKGGWVGIEIGLSYHYKENRFISLESAFATVAIAPVGPIDYDGEYELQHTQHLSLIHSTKKGKLSFGTGISLSRYQWSFNRSFIDPLRPDDPVKVVKNHNALGLHLNAYYQHGKNFSVGVIYRPTYFVTSPNLDNRYGHLISLDMAWKIILF